MGLTVTNINTLQLLRLVNQSSIRQNDVLTQLSTGKRINKGADDPAGLIALKNLESELTAVDSAIANGQRTDAVMGVADSALGEVYSLLTEIESLVVASSSDANLSSAELAANQAQIDLAIRSIDRVVTSTNFNGRRLLDGTGAISATPSSAGATQDIKIFNRGNLSSDLTLTVDLTTAAQAATTASNTTDSVNFGGANTSGTTELAVTGSLGTATVTIGSGVTAAGAASVINLAADQTGVSATTSGNYLVYNSRQSGSANFLSVDVISGGNITGGGDSFANVAKTAGVDAQGTINGSSFTADGDKVSFNVGSVSGSFSIGSSFTAATNQTITVSASGGFTFQLGTENSTRVTIGIDGLFTHRLGGGDSGGFLSELSSGGGADLSSASSRATALSVVKESINDVATAQGRIGGFQKFQVQPALASLNATKVGLSEVTSVIGDTDYALATAELNKESVLLNSGISLLGLANQQAAQILSLLGA